MAVSAVSCRAKEDHPRRLLAFATHVPVSGVLRNSRKELSDHERPPSPLPSGEGEGGGGERTKFRIHMLGREAGLIVAKGGGERLLSVAI